MTDAQRGRVEDAARAVLTAREPHLPPRGMSTLADLYDPLAMPRDLARAHAELDRAVERCYRAEAFQSDRERVEVLFRLYEQLTAPLLPAAPRRRTARTRIQIPRRSQRGRTPGLPAADYPGYHHKLAVSLADKRRRAVSKTFRRRFKTFCRHFQRF